VDRDYALYSEGVFEKKVYSPEWLIENSDDVYIVIAASNVYRSFDSISAFLKENCFPEDHIISSMPKLNHAIAQGKLSEEYFDFMDLYQNGTAFLDCGGYDGFTSIEFAKYSKNEYSKIFMFEPDSRNVILCEQAKRFNKLHDLEIIEAGCSDENGEILFEAGLNGMSHFANSKSKYTEKIKTVRIDDVVVNTKVGFIKMDIEGAEMRALKGAEETIKRDKPLLAICVYHKPGDAIEIMNYLNQLIPEYRFWLRPYAEDASETVLYASV
jgi:FkbM family methyltransferase